MIRLAAILALTLAACSAPSPDVAITRTEPRPDAQPNAWAAQPETTTTTTTEPVRVRAAAVTTTPPKAPEPVQTFTGDIPALIRAIWPDDSEEMAVRVAWCESRHNPAAANPRSSARGLFQLLLSYHSHRFDGHWYDPAANTRAALSLFSEQGWNPWRASSHCWGAA